MKMKVSYRYLAFMFAILLMSISSLTVFAQQEKNSTKSKIEKHENTSSDESSDDKDNAEIHQAEIAPYVNVTKPVVSKALLIVLQIGVAEKITYRNPSFTPLSKSTFLENVFLTSICRKAP